MGKRNADRTHADERAAGILRGMISLSHELRKTVVAEGIETEEQARMLQGCACDDAQSYFYGRPMDKEALLASLHAGLRGPSSP